MFGAVLRVDFVIVQAWLGRTSCSDIVKVERGLDACFVHFSAPL